jgi:hypothetical protein
MSTASKCVIIIPSCPELSNQTSVPVHGCMEEVLASHSHDLNRTFASLLHLVEVKPARYHEISCLDVRPPASELRVLPSQRAT